MIRAFRFSDVSDLLPLYDQLGYPVGQEELTERLTQLFQSPAYSMLVIEVDGIVRGFLGYAKMYFFEASGFYYRILALVVDEDYRHQGLARSLMTFLAEEGRRKGAKALALNSGFGETRETAHRFYQNFGFAKASYGFRYDL
ncbi:GNAT superfamily N-acetyltransferase [Streptococcus saliviloxodontae]|uniref:GNAT superfamily N-acetyltransferase n=2 Tax=Streptococcus saliviloxodontae TaxID=1349416 RepID=A0ABS2PNJ3_9STRE|nr:GNAT superfamily N-acetyltransferase [Streptococcus saliviloxodontae]